MLKEIEETLQEFKKKYEVNDLASLTYNQLERLNEERGQLLKKYTAKHPDIVHIDKEIEVLRRKLSQYSEDELTFARLKRDVQIYQTLYNDLKPKLTNATIETEKVPDISVVNEATFGINELGNNKGLNLVVGGIIISLILGLGLGFIIEHLDTSLGTIEQIEQQLKLPVIGVIPYLAKKEEGSQLSPHKNHLAEIIRSQLILNFNPLSPIREAYHILSTNITKNNSANSDKRGQIIAVTSAGPGEGKSVTAINLAITMAINGEKVLLIDADIRKSIIHMVFSIDKEPGLSDLLLGNQNVTTTIHDVIDNLVSGGLSYDVITKTPALYNLYILTAGQTVASPAGLISYINKEDSFLSDLVASYNYLILDCPPVLPVMDMLIWGTKANAVILVYHAGKTAKNALIRTVEQLQKNTIPIQGVVLNHLTPEIEVSPNYYYYHYSQYHTKKEQSETKPIVSRVK